MEEEVCHTGGCHCEAVRFRAFAPAVVRAIKCNCSICVKKQITTFLVNDSKFEITQGKDNLTTYSYNTMQAKHMFCKTCGVQPFYKPRAVPNTYGIITYCVDPGTLQRVEVETFDGVNYEKSLAESDLPSRYQQK